MVQAPVFKGTSQVSLDSKGRVPMPAKYRNVLRQQFEGKFVITANPDRCLLLYLQSYWDEKVEPQLLKLPDMNKQVRRIKRFFLGHAAECEMNSQGRILLPLSLRQFANLQKNVSLIGQGTKFELWDSEQWHTQRDTWIKQESDTKDVHEVLEKIQL